MLVESILISLFKGKLKYIIRRSKSIIIYKHFLVELDHKFSSTINSSYNNFRYSVVLRLVALYSYSITNFFFSCLYFRYRKCVDAYRVITASKGIILWINTFCTNFYVQSHFSNLFILRSCNNLKDSRFSIIFN